MTVRAQLQQCTAHIFVQIGRCHSLQITTINCILLICKRLLLLRSESVFLLTQDNVKALHTADTAQPVIDRRIKRKIKFLCQRSPRRKMEFVSMAKHTIQIKNICSKSSHNFSKCWS